MNRESKDVSKKSLEHLIVIGASAGGFEAISFILERLGRIPQTAIAVVLHLPRASNNLLPSLLQNRSEWHVKEAESTEALTAETIYIAPPDYHLNVEKDLSLSLSNDDPHLFSRPAIDILFETAAQGLREKVTGILLTGASADGAEGLKQIHLNGGKTIVQDPKTALFGEMPSAALKLIKPTAIFDLNGIKKYLEGLDFNS